MKRKKAPKKEPYKSTPQKEKAYVDAVVKGASQTSMERTSPVYAVYKELSKNRR